MIAAVATFKKKNKVYDADNAENKVEDDTLIQFTSDPVAALGAGALFGESRLGSISRGGSNREVAPPHSTTPCVLALFSLGKENASM